jgi:trans-aconitate 2-methyltransferase
MKLTQKYLLAFFSFLSISLNADSPNWSIDDVKGGWNHLSLTKLYFHNSETQRQWAWELLGKHSFKGNEKVLDFGCGDGKITAEISRLIPNGSILGVDLSAEMVHFANMRFPHFAYPNLTYAQSHSLTFMDNSKNQPLYDIIASFAVFHLIGNPLETLKNLKTCLKPSGKLLLVIPSDANSLVFQAAVEMFAKYDIPAPWNKNAAATGHSMRTLEGCSFFLKEAGYEIESLEIIDSENAFYDLEELTAWMASSGAGNWNIPYSICQTFFADLVQRFYELEPTIIDQDGRVRLRVPRIHAIATNANEI